MKIKKLCENNKNLEIRYKFIRNITAMFLLWRIIET